MLIPELLDPYASMIIDRTIEEPLLVPSSMWAIGRLGTQIKPAVSFFQEPVLRHFRSNNPDILGLAAWAMGEVRFEPALPELAKLQQRDEPVRIYIGGQFHSRTIGNWSSISIAKINSENIS